VPRLQHTLIYPLAALSAISCLCYGGFLLLGTPMGNASSTAARPTAAGTVSSPDGPVPAAIHAMVRRGSLAVTLAVSPLDVGAVRFVASVEANGKPVTADRVRLRLSMPSQPIFGVAILKTTLRDGRYRGQGQLQALGRWHVDVLMCPSGIKAACPSVPFDLMNGANARFLFAQPPDTRFGPASVALTRAPEGGSTLRVHLRAGLAVRAIMDMPNMLSMGAARLGAQPQAHGWYGVSLAFPMTGVARVVLQVHTPTGWQAIRTLLYDVDSAGNATPLTNTQS
jgi:hypothetical protein